MPKARTGTLALRKGSWHVRLTLDIDGEVIRRWFNLETADKVVARRKAARLAKQHASAASVDVAAVEHDAKRVETYREAADRIRKQRETEGDRFRQIQKKFFVFSPSP